jgi:hypothetical protein
LGGKNKIIKPSYGTSCSSFFSNHIPFKIKALKSFNNFSKLHPKNKKKLHQSSTNHQPISPPKKGRGISSLLELTISASLLNRLNSKEKKDIPTFHSHYLPVHA